MLNFKPCGLFGKELHRVEGYIQDKRYGFYFLALIVYDYLDIGVELCCLIDWHCNNSKVF